MVSPSHGVLPKSYFPTGVTLSDAIPYASGGFADIWKGELDGHPLWEKKVLIVRGFTSTSAYHDQS